ncbi:MAG: DUF4363 family protein [Candidatus Wallacebacter cryptica]|jgi:hypothetical protein|nr:DUF4363 family protein [Bacillota bacterium]
MRLLIGSTVLIIVFLIAAGYVTNQTLEFINNYREELKQLRQVMLDQDWHQAQNLVGQLRQKWDGVQDYWDWYIVHEDIENVEVALARLVSFIDSQDLSSGLAELAQLDMHFSHIYRNELFNLQNVL